MTVEKMKKKKVPSKTKEKEIIFTCKFCEQRKPLTEMAVLTRFYPPLVICKECGKSGF